MSGFESWGVFFTLNDSHIDYYLERCVLELHKGAEWTPWQQKPQPSLSTTSLDRQNVENGAIFLPMHILANTNTQLPISLWIVLSYLMPAGKEKKNHCNLHNHFLIFKRESLCVWTLVWPAGRLWLNLVKQISNVFEDVYRHWCAQKIILPLWEYLSKSYFKME